MKPLVEIGAVSSSTRRGSGDAQVYLRLPSTKDREEFLALGRSSERFYRNLTSAPRTAAEFTAFLDRAGRDDHEVFLVCRRDDDAILGMIAINQIVRGNLQSAYLGLRIGAAMPARGT